MALSASSLIFYGLTIDMTNQSLDFISVNAGTEKKATLTTGYYSPTKFCTMVKNALQTADPLNTYTVAIDRTLVGGTAPRVTISTSGSFLSLKFLTGTRNGNSCYASLGYTKTDKTGATSYLAEGVLGRQIVSVERGYSYLGPEFRSRRFGQVNISANGAKESITYGLQQFLNVEFMYEPYSAVVNKWTLWGQWSTAQNEFEFTPEITSPNTFYNVTLESTSFDGKGLGIEFREMLPDCPLLYRTGPLIMRVVV